MHFVDYADLCERPRETLHRIYDFLGEQPYEHDFEQVEQVIVEDDFAYGYKDLHVIRCKVEPQKPAWPRVFDSTVLESATWKRVEEMARFWKGYVDT